jgi:glyoxylase I family protein
VGTRTSSRNDLREVNVGIGVAEKAHDLEFLGDVLDDDLIFRRADSKIVGKDAYLEALRARTYDDIATEISEVDEQADSAVVTAIVTASGASDGKPFSGTFRNVRTFVADDDGWRCTLWINTRVGPGVGTIHHVSLPVTDLERSRRFYREILSLREIERPYFDFPGAWFAVGGGHLHLIVGENQTFRGDNGLDARDVHFAVRVPSYRVAKQFLESKGYNTEADDLSPMKLRANPRPTAGFPQLYVLDPDRHVVEINAEKLDAEALS